jgi:hypothetical protein
MKKLRMAIEALTVESFDVVGMAQVGTGTVQGHGTGAMDGCTAGAGNCYNVTVANTCHKAGVGYCANDPNDPGATWSCGAATCDGFTCQGEMTCATCYGMNTCHCDPLPEGSGGFTCYGNC